MSNPEVEQAFEGFAVLFPPIILCLIADLVQLVEHLICNQRVNGSNPLIGMGLWRETGSLVRNSGIGFFLPQVYLVSTYHPRCWEGWLVRCSLATDVVGVSDWDERCTNQLHHFYCGDVRQCGEPLVCGASVSRFESDTSHESVT